MENIITRRKIRKYVKTLYQLKRVKFSIVIASSGRSASTMLWTSIGESWFKHRKRLFSSISKEERNRIILDTAWRLGNKKLKNGIVYKTHDLPPFDICKNTQIKYLFVYGNPLDSCVSVANMVKKKGEIWFKEHLFQLHGNGNLEDLFDKDVLNYEMQVKSWTSLTCSNVLCIKYDDIWKRKKDIELFLGFPLIIPLMKQRYSNEVLANNINTKLFNHLKQIYLESGMFDTL